jgi:hypothetical protein
MLRRDLPIRMDRTEGVIKEAGAMRTPGSVRSCVLILVLVFIPLLNAAPATAADPILREGSRGTAVVQLQTQLTQLRYDVGAIDGVFGPSTRHAVVAFQKVNGLTRDGVVGPRTWAALRRPVAPVPRRVRPGTHIEVDLTRQIVLLARDGRLVRIIDTSTGKPSTPTPTGAFRVERRIDGWRTSSLGTLWRPAYFHRGYAIHGSSSVPPYAASSGCVRLINPSMNRLWPHATVGTRVDIYR